MKRTVSAVTFDESGQCEFTQSEQSSWRSTKVVLNGGGRIFYFALSPLRKAFCGHNIKKNGLAVKARSLVSMWNSTLTLLQAWLLRIWGFTWLWLWFSVLTNVKNAIKADASPQLLWSFHPFHSLLLISFRYICEVGKKLELSLVQLTATTANDHRCPLELPVSQ